MPIDQAAQQFEQTVKDRLTEATNKTEYSFTRVNKMIKDAGAVEAAKRLVRPTNSGKIHDGLQVLIDNNLIHLSIEQAVIVFENEGLFSEDEISSAQGRLAMARMKSGKTNISERLKKGD
jgi:hypothetical protein